MKEQFVTYEQALALKELGFDEPCFGVYATKDGYVRKSAYDENGDAPTYSQAFRFFREKYNLYQDISAFAWNYDKKQLGFSIRTYLNPVNIETERKVYGEVYETYEEAELECLKKLIEIANEQSR
jgi:hypothetical protein